MPTLREVGYLGRDNTIAVRLLDAGVPVNLTATNRAVLTLGTSVIDSNVMAGVFDWTSAGASGILKINLGSASQPPASLTPGRYLATLVLFDAVNNDGIVWTEPTARTLLSITVKSGY